MPEAHPVGRIDGCHGIIAPASIGVGLAPGAREHCSLTLAKVIGRITGQTTGITNVWERGAAGCGIADGSVTRVIDGDARHKAIQTVVAVGPGLLLHSR